MALSTSPRKAFPIATGSEIRPRPEHSGLNTTKRVFFCGVVVEGSENQKPLPEEIQELVLSLGEVLEGEESENGMLSSRSDNGASQSDQPTTRKRALTDSSALSSAINELVATERSYVKRLQVLKRDYADPLRNFARSKSTAILPKYEAKTLFGNIDNLLPVNEAFLTDLEKMIAPNGSKTVGGIGDVALRHFKDLRGFEQYKGYYVKREEAQLIFEREVSKKSSFAAYIDRIKYQSADMKNRIGLRELLMDPVQRIPRYTLLFRLMIKHMAQEDPQRAKLVEADEIASKIALAEADEQTQRAAIFYCLSATIEGFPPDLFSNQRRFIDCIDVEELPVDAPLSSAASASSSNLSPLHCSLFLFDDKMLLVKRPGNGEKGGRSLSGLDELDKFTKAGMLPNGKKKSGMACKGVFDITDVVATDVGSGDFHLYLENPPQDVGDRWSGRPFRALSVVHPPAPPNLDPTQSEVDKQRFLENLWKVQANYRARAGQSVVLRAQDVEVESKGGKVTIGRTYYNVYQRTAFLQELKKTKIVVHVDADGLADDIPFGIASAPFVVIRLQPLAGGVCRYEVTSSDPSDPGEKDIVQTARVPSRVVLTIHQFGLFQFRTGKNSRPPTPTAKSKASIFGLDAISRTLFPSTRSGTSMGDFFTGSINSHRRTKSTTSRSSTYTSTADSSFKFSHRSNSTAATTVSGHDDESFGSSPSRSSKKRKQRGRSPEASDKEGTFVSSLSRSFSRSRSASCDRASDWTDTEGEDEFTFEEKELNTSDRDLALQLELARRNSKNQNDRQYPTYSQPPEDAPIYEGRFLHYFVCLVLTKIPEEPPLPMRPASRASTSRDSNSQCTITGDTLQSPAPQRRRSLSRGSSYDRRPLGPRAPSPIPPSPSPRPLSPAELRSMDEDLASVLESMPQTPASSSRPTNIPRSKRQSFHPLANGDHTPRGPGASTSTTIEPLSIKKKTSVRSGTDADSPAPRRSGRTSLSRAPSKRNSPRRVSPQVKLAKIAGTSVATAQVLSEVENILHLAQATKEDVESGHRAIKRLKVEIEKQGSSAAHMDDEPISRPSSPIKGLRTPQRVPPPLTKAAQERLDEMQRMIGQRHGELTPRNRAPGPFGTPLRTHSSMDSPTLASSAPLNGAGLGSLASDADASLVKALTTLESLQASTREVSQQLKERTNDLERKNIELQNAKRQLEVMKSLLEETTKEKEIMYEAFNEELDGMYNDINLPDNEAWSALTNDLREAKAARNELSKENSEFKRRLAEIELQLEECQQENCRTG
uniref:DH domain-containing protein n=1 Tax=Moniliophthora roreri TaxID=221103 RepID=A0A0W0EZG9_MONRR